MERSAGTVPEALQSINELIRNARRAKGLTQSGLAARAKCKQSAISMFEAGRTNVLASETIAGVAKILDIDIKLLAAEQKTAAGSPTRLKYCPVDECPANVPYVVRGALHFLPSLTVAAEGEKSRCRFCGELLEEQCPNPACAARVEQGAFCPHCGAAYVTTVAGEMSDPVAWADAQRKRIGEARQLARG
jgi:transcriptional regulator with XRE-family HTH domain